MVMRSSGPIAFTTPTMSTWLAVYDLTLGGGGHSERILRASAPVTGGSKVYPGDDGKIRTGVFRYLVSEMRIRS